MKTKLILQKDVPNLGLTGDMIDVAPGYARNYLLPQALAVVASPRNVERWNEKKQKLSEENKAKLTAAQEQAEKIKQIVCSFSVRAGEDGKLFGSITSAEVAAALAKQGFVVDRRNVDLSGHIRTIGEFTGRVRLHPQVRASFKIQVSPTA
jgi:large subunit ribosomal protein L9